MLSYQSSVFPSTQLSNGLLSFNRQGEIKVMSGVQSTPVWSILTLLSLYSSYMNMLVVLSSA